MSIISLCLIIHEMNIKVIYAETKCQNNKCTITYYKYDECIKLHEEGHEQEYLNNNNISFLNETYADNYMMDKNKSCKRFYSS